MAQRFYVVLQTKLQKAVSMPTVTKIVQAAFFVQADMCRTGLVNRATSKSGMHGDTFNGRLRKTITKGLITGRNIMNETINESGNYLESFLSPVEYR